MAIDSHDIPRNPHRGSPRWFFVDKKLNNYGYLPGAPRRDRDALPDIVVNEEKCAKRWGPKQHGKFWYARPGSSESPRMIQRIESLYEVTHQRPMGKQRCIGLAFARGLIAEKLGHAVDWASFAAKQCQRGGRPFISLEELRSKTRRESGWWPRIEASELNANDLEGAPDDWEVNRHPRQMNMRLINGYDLKDALPTRPDTVVSPPLYGRVVHIGVSSHADSDTASSGSDSSEKIVNNHGTAPLSVEEVQSAEVPPIATQGSPIVEGGNEWDSCPVSPGPVSPVGGRQVGRSTSDSDYEPSDRHRTETSIHPSAGVERDLEDIVSDEDVLGVDISDRVHAELDHWAVEAGFYTIEPEAQLTFLQEKETEFKRESKKRKAEEEAQEGWLTKMRWKTIDMAFPPEGNEASQVPDCNIVVDKYVADSNVSVKFSPLRFQRRPLLLPREVAASGSGSGDYDANVGRNMGSINIGDTDSD
ncbi:hypothetical protein KC19_N044500 [Ceratodon purpureus]|nr:hypothetical protein KC19_N044500 [Ceratodon purpureus]